MSCPSTMSAVRFGDFCAFRRTMSPRSMWVPPVYAARGQLTPMSSLGRPDFRPFPASCQATPKGGSMIVKAGRTPRILPFPMDDIERTSEGVLRYTKLVPSLVHLLRATVEADPQAEALVELGGERLTYQQLWDRSSRVAGGLRAMGINRGDRVAIRLGNGNAWAL